MVKRFLAVLLALAMLLSVSAVFAETAAEETEAAEATPVPDTLLVTINGYEVRENNELLQSYYSDLMADNTNPDEDYIRLAKMYSMLYVLQTELINEKKAVAFTEDELAVLEQEARNDWNTLIDEILAEQYGITESSSEEEKTSTRATVLSLLEYTYGYTEDVYVESSISNAFAEKVTEELKASNPDLAATEEEIQQAYQDLMTEEMEGIGNDVAMYEFYQSYQGYQFHFIPEGYRGIIHILLTVDQALLDNWTDLRARLEENDDEAEATDETESADDTEETEEPVTAEMVEAARQAILDSQKEKIDTIMERLDKGEAFETLIAEFGEDPGMQDEEYLKNGYQVHKDGILYDTDFTDAAAALEKVGDVSDPVVTQFGIHILYYLRDVPAGPLEMTDEARSELQSEIEEERLNLAISELLDQWEAEADIVWTEEGESWKFDQAAVDAYSASWDDEDYYYDDLSDESAETETETEAEPEETPAE